MISNALNVNKPRMCEYQAGCMRLDGSVRIV